MKPFTLEWWVIIKNKYWQEYITVRDQWLKGGVTVTFSTRGRVKSPEEQRIDELIEIMRWIDYRIINKYGE